jgi:hypothetical protein
MQHFSCPPETGSTLSCLLPHGFQAQLRSASIRQKALARLGIDNTFVLQLTSYGSCQMMTNACSRAETRLSLTIPVVRFQSHWRPQPARASLTLADAPSTVIHPLPIFQTQCTLL